MWEMSAIWMQFRKHSAGWLSSNQIQTLRIKAATLMLSNSVYLENRELPYITLLEYGTYSRLVSKLDRVSQLSAAGYLTHLTWALAQEGDLDTAKAVFEDAEKIIENWPNDEEFQRIRLALLYYIIVGASRCKNFDVADTYIDAMEKLAKKLELEQSLAQFVFASSLTLMLGELPPETKYLSKIEHILGLLNEIYSDFSAEHPIFADLLVSSLCHEASIRRKLGDHETCIQRLKEVEELNAKHVRTMRVASYAASCAQMILIPNTSELEKRNWLSRVENLLSFNCPDDQTPIDFWMMIAHHHMLLAYKDENNFDETSKCLDNVAQLFSNHPDEIKFTYWYGNSLIHYAVLCINHAEYVIARRLIEETMQPILALHENGYSSGYEKVESLCSDVAKNALHITVKCLEATGENQFHFCNQVANHAAKLFPENRDIQGVLIETQNLRL